MLQLYTINSWQEILIELPDLIKYGQIANQLLWEWLREYFNMNYGTLGALGIRTCVLTVSCLHFITQNCDGHQYRIEHWVS